MDQNLLRLKKLANLMDSSFKGPLGLKFGLDGLLGLVPFVGDLITSCISLYIIVQAALMGCPPSVLIRMGLNVLFENVLDMVPLFGNIFDFIWKSNNKNIALLEMHTVNPTGAKFSSRLVLGLISFSILAIMVASLAVSILVLDKIITWIT
jgi:hypothetical protein